MTTKRTRRSADRTQLAQNASTNRLQIQFEPCTSQQNGRPPGLELAPICTACVPHRFLAATATLDHGCKKFQTTETSGERSLLAGCGRRGHEPRKGDFGGDTSQGRFWLRQRPSNNDHGTLPPLLRWHALCSRVIRTRWRTNPTTSSSG